MSKKWFCNMIALSIALSLEACYVDANASVTDISYVQETDDEESDISDKDFLTYYSGFDYAYFRLSWLSGCYSSTMQQSCFVSLTDEEAKKIDDVFSRTLSLLENYEMSLNFYDFEKCNHYIQGLKKIVPEIQEALIPVLVPDLIYGKDNDELVFDEGCLSLKSGEDITVIDDGFLSSKPSTIEELNKWFGLFGEDIMAPYSWISTDNNSKVICQLSIIDLKAFSVYNYMIINISNEFSVDPFSIKIINNQILSGEHVLRELTDNEKKIIQSRDLIDAAKRYITISPKTFMSAVDYINKVFEKEQEGMKSDYSQDPFPYGEDYDFPYKKTI